MFVKYPDDNYTLKNNLAKLDEIESVCMEKGWDSYDAAPLPLDVVEQAREILKGLGDLPQPFIAPTASGEIQLEWELENGFYLQIDIDSDLKQKYDSYCAFCSLWNKERETMIFQMSGTVERTQYGINTLIRNVFV